MPHRQLKHEEIKKKFSALTTQPALPVVLVVNHIKNATNLGALFRLADAAGIREIYTLGAPVHNEVKVRKVARATDRHVRLKWLKTKEDPMALKKDFELVALEVTADSIFYSAYRPGRAVALIIGNEKDGIEADILEMVDQSIHIPMYGHGENPAFNERLLPAADRPFGKEIWTHVVIVYSHLNTGKWKAQFYINGKSQGSRNIPEPFTWELDKAKIFLGLNYVGLLDEVSIFNRTLTATEVRRLYELPGGVESLMKE